MKIAIAQLNPIIGDIKNNAQKIIEVAHQASQDNVELLLTPELSLCGYPPKDLLFRHDFITMMAEELKAIALKVPKNISLLIGLATENPQAMEKGEKPLYNSIALIQKGEIKQIFHKQLLPNYDVFEEKRYFAIGKNSNYFEINNIKIGVTICEDLWNDELFWGKKNYKINPIKSIQEKGVELILNLSASPYVLRKQQLRETMLKYLVNRHKIPIIYANQVGGNDDLIFDGNSFAVNKQSQIVVRGKGYQTDLIYLEYSSQTKDILPGNIATIATEEEEIYQALILGVKDYAHKCGFNKAVLGLSGGIDSALVAKIAVDALGKENVLGVLMPSPYSSEYSIIDAQHLAKNLEIKTEKIPIKPMMDNFNTSLQPVFNDNTFGIAQENLQSRIRGTILMALANKYGYLLLSTGNKSEMAVGYCTLYGDMNGGLAVIADIPKTKVFGLCRWLNHEQEIIPNNIIIKPPSAELKPEQKDEDSLPPYPILDEILERYLNFHQSEKDIINSGYDYDTVKKVLKLVVRAEFKRKQAPPVLKITDRAFGTGWKMPIASRW
ncbi:NAD+ synthase [Cyanobacterium stanieri LEGE 03274]|uniref:Glutamine-dependent NAD(+) synthetase n=1 Tax=Cyanobacterium stanieri LEGE 03274 TaxID=1828756 RepID=A0ABR9V855_9CHRO|nr:NAD+ synthase [Cyanobacterium stanieri]MBE9223311.1 NAD+ synthase [Cyanobacterium stanieri LEGE 03274]